MKLTIKIFAFLLFAISVSNAEVIVSSVPEIGIDYKGLLDENSSDGLGANLWHNSLVMKKNILSSNPYDYYLSKTSYDLLLRILTTVAAPPLNSNKKDGDFLTKKLNLLFNLGAFNETIKIIDDIPSNLVDIELKKIKYDAMLASFFYKGTCALIAKESETDVYFDRMNVFCNLYRKKYEQASLIIQIMREQKIKGELFYGLADAIMNNTPLIEPESSSYLSPIYLGLYRINGKEFSLPLEKNTELWLLKTTFENGKASFNTRIKAGERLVSFGAISSNRFKNFLLKEKNNKAAKAYEHTADFYKVVNEKDDTKQAEYISEALKAARKQKLFRPYAMLYSEILAKISPQASNINSSYEVIPALLYAGNYEHASDWQKIAERESEVNKIAKKSAFTYAPLIKIITGTVHYGSSSIALKRFHDIKSEEGEQEKDILSEISFLLKIYDAYNLEYDSQIWLSSIGLPSKDAVSTVSKNTKELVNAISSESNGDALLLGLKNIKNKEAFLIFIEFLRKSGLKSEMNGLTVDVILEKII